MAVRLKFCFLDLVWWYIQAQQLYVTIPGDTGEVMLYISSWPQKLCLYQLWPGTIHNIGAEVTLFLVHWENFLSLKDDSLHSNAFWLHCIYIYQSVRWWWTSHPFLLTHGGDHISNCVLQRHLAFIVDFTVTASPDGLNKNQQFTSFWNIKFAVRLFRNGCCWFKVCFKMLLFFFFL